MVDSCMGVVCSVLMRLLVGIFISWWCLVGVVRMVVCWCMRLSSSLGRPGMTTSVGARVIWP